MHHGEAGGTCELVTSLFMSILGYVKIYQFRHPNAIQNAYSTFMILGILVLLEAVVLFSQSFLEYELTSKSFPGPTVSSQLK